MCLGSVVPSDTYVFENSKPPRKLSIAPCNGTAGRILDDEAWLWQYQ